MLQGEADLRCPAADNEQLFVALRALDRTVEYVLYPGRVAPDAVDRTPGSADRHARAHGALVPRPTACSTRSSADSPQRPRLRYAVRPACAADVRTCSCWEPWRLLASACGAPSHVTEPQPADEPPGPRARGAGRRSRLLARPRVRPHSRCASPTRPGPLRDPHVRPAAGCRHRRRVLQRSRADGRAEGFPVRVRMATGQDVVHRVPSRRRSREPRCSERGQGSAACRFRRA